MRETKLENVKVFPKLKEKKNGEDTKIFKKFEKSNTVLNQNNKIAPKSIHLFIYIYFFFSPLETSNILGKKVVWDEYKVKFQLFSYFFFIYSAKWMTDFNSVKNENGLEFDGWHTHFFFPPQRLFLFFQNVMFRVWVLFYFIYSSLSEYRFNFFSIIIINFISNIFIVNLLTVLKRKSRLNWIVYL